MDVMIVGLVLLAFYIWAIIGIYKVFNRIFLWLDKGPNNKEDVHSLRITKGRIQSPDDGEWHELTNQELKIMNEHLEVTK